jgi:hypothetical protein
LFDYTNGLRFKNENKTQKVEPYTPVARFIEGAAQTKEIQVYTDHCGVPFNYCSKQMIF